MEANNSGGYMKCKGKHYVCFCTTCGTRIETLESVVSVDVLNDLRQLCADVVEAHLEGANTAPLIDKLRKAIQLEV